MRNSGRSFVTTLVIFASQRKQMIAMTVLATFLLGAFALVGGHALIEKSEIHPSQGNTTTTRTNNPDGSTTVTTTTTYQDGSTITTTTYDKEGNDAGTTRVDKQTKDGETTITTTTYDGKGHVTGKTIERIDKDGNRTTTVIDPATGGVKSSTTIPAPIDYEYLIRVAREQQGLLYGTTFTPRQGKIKVNLTNDLAAGDTISGTVETEPAGKNDAERAHNQTELNGYVVELEGQKTTVGNKKFTCKIPTVLTPEAKTIVLQHNGQTVATIQIPISATPPPAPTQFTLPTGGQQGKPLQLKGPCDGVFSPQDHIKVGPTILPPVAKSPRSLVVLNTSDVVGPTTIECNENGVATQCPFRNIRVNLSAPRLNLQRGETTTLHVHVLGLAGITEDDPLDLEDTSPTVIKMSGGEIQHIIIHPAEVQRDGTYSTDRTLTGIMAGGFGVTGTVRWADVCKHPGK